MNAEKKPSEPKIDINALATVLEEKMGAQEKRLLDGFRRIMQEEQKRRNEFVAGLLSWIASQFRK